MNIAMNVLSKITPVKMKNEYHKTITRPLKLSLIFSVFGELIIFSIWGLLLYPEGNPVHKFIWTVVFCGVGMGSTVGTLYILFVEGRYRGKKAILACALISTIVLGVFCNFLCFQLDMHFGFFGAQDTPMLFIFNGIIMSAFAGSMIGWLNYTKSGNELLGKLKLL